MKYVLQGIFSISMLLVACMGCGDGPVEPPVIPPLTKDDDARAVHVVNKICVVDVAARGGFEITCPQPIEWIHHGQISDKKAIKIDTYMNGHRVDLQVEKVGDNRVVGITTNARLRITLSLADGRKEVIHIH